MFMNNIQMHLIEFQCSDVKLCEYTLSEIKQYWHNLVNTATLNQIQQLSPNWGQNEKESLAFATEAYYATIQQDYYNSSQWCTVFCNECSILIWEQQQVWIYSI